MTSRDPFSMTIGMAVPCCFSRSKCNWLDKLRASKGFPVDVDEVQIQGNPGITRCCSSEQEPISASPNSSDSSTVINSQSSSPEIVYAFGLPPADFHPTNTTTTTATTIATRQQQRKRKQERPRNCSGGSGQEVTGPRLQALGGEAAVRRRSSCYKLSPESGNPNPSCRMQLRECYGLDCSDDKGSSWKSCMEKMQAFSLRSDSDDDDQGNPSDSTLDSLNSHHHHHHHHHLHHRSHLCSSKRRRKLPFQVDDQGLLLTQQQQQQHQQLQQQQQPSSRVTTGFVADFHTGAAAAACFKGPVKQLPPDHPACQPKDTLVYSLYLVFIKAGKAGLTAREAVSKILEDNLPGLDDCGVSARVEVVKLVRSSPYFMQLDESKFVLCSVITGAEEKVNNNSTKNAAAAFRGQEEEQKKQEQEQVHEEKNWAAPVAVRRARTGKTRRKAVCVDTTGGNSNAANGTGGIRKGGMVISRDSESKKQQQQQQQQQQQPARKRRLKCVQQDSTGLGNRCNRSDGKGWHCPLLAQVGYLLCDHHLDRLRSKSGSKARRPNRNRGRGGRGEQPPVPVAAAAAAAAKGGAKRKNGKVESWGVRQSLSVARGGRSSKNKRVKKQEEELCGEHEEVITSFGL